MVACFEVAEVVSNISLFSWFVSTIFLMSVDKHFLLVFTGRHCWILIFLSILL
jgi:hypothetical protein